MTTAVSSPGEIARALVIRLLAAAIVPDMSAGELATPGTRMATRSAVARSPTDTAARP